MQEKKSIQPMHILEQVQPFCASFKYWGFFYFFHEKNIKIQMR